MSADNYPPGVIDRYIQQHFDVGDPEPKPCEGCCWRLKLRRLDGTES